MRAGLVMVVLLGCASPPAAPVATPTALPRASLIEITDRGLGPITKDTRVTLTSLRRSLAPAGLTVTAAFDTSLQFNAKNGKDEQFYIVGNDDGSLLYLHATSPAIRVRRHASWIVGRRFYDAALLSFCDCWGETAVCWAAGEHVAVGFARNCHGLDSDDGRAALQEQTIARVVWSPTPFTDGDDAASARPSLLPDAP